MGADHKALQEGMLMHAEIMDWGIQNDLYTIKGLDHPNVVSRYVNMNMMRKIDLLRAYAKSWYVLAIEEVLNQVYQTKDYGKPLSYTRRDGEG